MKQIDDQTRLRLERLELAEKLTREIDELKKDLLPARQKVGDIQRAINKKESERDSSLHPLPLYDELDSNGQVQPSEEWLAKPVSELAAKGITHKMIAELEAGGVKTYGDLATLDKQEAGELAKALGPILGGYNAQQVAQTFYRLAKKAK